MPYVLNFKKGAAHMSIRSYGFSMHQIFLNEADYIEFIERTINAHLPDHSNDPELFELVKTYQVYAHSRTCWKYNKNECCFLYGQYFTEKTIAKPLDSKFNDNEKKGFNMEKYVTKASQKLC